MSTCTFFGHRYAPKEIEPALRSVLLDLIENKGVKTFYVGNHGGFDAMAQRILRDFAARYSIVCFVVLAYMPKNKESNDYVWDTILPDGIETVPKRFAISYRNKWMIQKSDFVVTYVDHKIGSGAAQFKSLAEKRGKIVIEVS